MNFAFTIEDVRRACSDALIHHVASPWMDSDAAGKYLGCTPATLKTWRARGEGPAYHILNGKLVRYHRDELDAFVRGEVSR